MIDLPEGPPTIRQRIMSVLLARFEAQRRGVDGAILTWDTVTDKPMSHVQQTSGSAIGLYDTSEKKSDLTGAVECRLNVVMEFHINMAEGDDLTQIMRAVLGEVQRVASSDLNTKEPDGYHLTIDVKEMGNELENIAEKATRGSGVVVFELKYRHKPGKPDQRR